MKPKIINQVREFRKSSAMTQDELAHLTKVSRQSIISIEKGKYIPSLPLALKLSQIFNCSTDKLFFLEEKHHG